jgi:hypothetical protein
LTANLIEVFSSIKRSVVMIMKMHGKRIQFSRLLPTSTTTVARQRIVDGTIIVYVVAGQN